MTVKSNPSPSLCPMRSLENVDPFDSSVLSHPESYWAKLRNDAPIHRVRLPNSDIDVFFVTRRADIDYIASRPEMFSSRTSADIFRWPDQPQEILDVFGGKRFASTFVTADPPFHREYRRVADAGLSLRKIQEWHPTILGIVDRLMAGLPDGEPFDFVERFAAALPSEVIRTILDLPRDDQDFLVWFTDEYMAMVDPATPMPIAIQRAEGVQRAREYLLPRIAAYRENPKNNFFSIIANGRHENGDLMDEEEVLSMVFITIIGGNETTRNALASATMYLATNPEIWAELKRDRSRVPVFIDEALRLASPSNFLPRTAKQDVEIHGVKIPAGSTLFLFWASGNRDERTFAEPDKIDLRRSNARSNLTFGKGPHFCAGSHLARSELTTTVERLLESFETIELAANRDEVKYDPVLTIRTLRHLPILLKRM